jgi:hypothetical protein
MEWITALAALYPLLWAINSARHMSRGTCHRVRIGTVLIGAAALSAALLPLYRAPPDWLMAAMLGGLSVVLAADRRPRR